MRARGPGRRPRQPARRPATLGVLLALAAAGCGHPATHDECEAIFQRSAEIELRSQHVTDPKVIAERTAAVRAARGEELIKQCVGRRITDSAIACVRRAETPEEVDRCLQ